MPTSLRLSGLRHQAVIFAAFSAAGGLCALPFVLASEVPAQTARQMLVPAAVAGGLAGTLTRAFLVSEEAPRWRAPFAGGLAGLLAHPLLWVWIGVAVGGEMGKGGGALLAGALLSSLFFSIFSAIAYGPLTVTVGALVGWWLARCPTTSARKAAKASTPLRAE